MGAELARFVHALADRRVGGAGATPPFLWATGIEDTFIDDPSPRSGRTLDAYALTRHYEWWRGDQARAAWLGVGAARYGIPWHRIQPSARRWDWRWSDAALAGLLARGVTPIVDLVHYGTPAHLRGAFLDPTYPDAVAEYAARAAGRLDGRLRWFTPLNEPRITAWYTGMLGWWPPYAHGWRGFVAVLLAICRGIVRSHRALRAAHRDAVLVHVDAADRYTATTPAAAPLARHRQRIGFLALDLVTGRVGPRHPLRPWLLAHGVATDALEWFEANAVVPDLIGLNLYPMFSDKRVEATPAGWRIRSRPGGGDVVVALARRYWRRYRRPLLITETAARGPVARRIAWLRESVAAARQLRAAGVPLLGYTWWPLYSLVGWAYREGNQPLSRYWVDMGLWDLDRGAELARRRTAAAEEYRALAHGGDAAVGPLRREAT